MYDLKGFGNRIEELRKKKGMTQENLAERLGVTSQAVSKWENSQCYPDIELIPTICAVFEVSLDDIFGKIKKDVSNLSFPPVYKGLNIVATFANIACYSDKEIKESDGSTITFKDGSIAELQSRRVVNRGAGKILLRALDETFVSEDTDKTKLLKLKKLEDIKLMPNHIDIEYGKLKKLECDVLAANFIINKAGGDKTTIFADGYPEFIYMLDFEYEKEEEQTLKVKFNHDRREEINNKIGEWDISKNKVIINLAFDGETFENLGASIFAMGDIKLNVPCINTALTIYGSGNIDAPVTSTNLAMTINGSGDIKTTEAVNLSASINGSGNIDFDKAVNCAASINGGGDINGNTIVNLSASINGSGDMNFHECGTVDIKIRDSGDFDVDKVNKSVTVSINGSGDVNIKSGEVEMFDVYIDNGEVRAKGVTTDRAKIEMPNSGTVEIGRVKIESIEKCGDNAEVIIHNRG